MRNPIYRALPLTIILTMVLALLPSGFVLASSADVTVVSAMQQAEPITIYSTSGSQISARPAACV